MLILPILLSTIPANASTLHGTAYDWSTFEPLENTLIEINSTPPQSLVAVNGEYSFELPPGTYQITAKHYRNGTLESTATENITITTEGNFVLDLLLLPVTDFEEEHIPENITTSEPIVTPENNHQQRLLFIIALLAITSLILLSLLRRQQKTQPQQNTAPPRQTGIREDTLPDDLQNIVSILKKNNGRMTQKELRAHLKHYSEAKVSLMLSELETRGIIDKIKKGRGNILLLKK